MWAPQEWNFSPLGFIQHDLFINVMCSLKPACGITPENIASSYMRWRGGRQSGGKKMQIEEYV